MKYFWNQFQNDQTTGPGSTTVSSSVASSRNTSGIRMEAYYFLSHRIAAVNTRTLVRRDTAVHVASRTLSNKHRLPPSTNSSAHSKSLNFLSSFPQFRAVFSLSTEPRSGPPTAVLVAPVPARRGIYPCKAYVVSSPPAPRDQSCGPHSWARTILSAHLEQNTTEQGGFYRLGLWVADVLGQRPAAHSRSRRQTAIQSIVAHSKARWP